MWCRDIGFTCWCWSVKDEPRASKWSFDFQKETPQYGSLRSRLIEEYTDCESLLEFAKKTILVLMKTSIVQQNDILCLLSPFVFLFQIEAATIFLGLLVIFPIIMIGIGKLNTIYTNVIRDSMDDCRRQSFKWLSTSAKFTDLSICCWDCLDNETLTKCLA